MTLLDEFFTEGQESQPEQELETLFETLNDDGVCVLNDGIIADDNDLHRVIGRENLNVLEFFIRQNIRDDLDNQLSTRSRVGRRLLTQGAIPAMSSIERVFVTLKVSDLVQKILNVTVRDGDRAGAELLQRWFSELLPDNPIVLSRDKDTYPILNIAILLYVAEKFTYWRSVFGHASAEDVWYQIKDILSNFKILDEYTGAIDLMTLFAAYIRRQLSRYDKTFNSYVNDYLTVYDDDKEAKSLMAYYLNKIETLYDFVLIDAVSSNRMILPSLISYEAASLEDIFNNAQRLLDFLGVPKQQSVNKFYTNYSQTLPFSTMMIFLRVILDNPQIYNPDDIDFSLVFKAILEQSAHVEKPEVLRQIIISDFANAFKIRGQLTHAQPIIQEFANTDITRDDKARIERIVALLIRWIDTLQDAQQGEKMANVYLWLTGLSAILTLGEQIYLNNLLERKNLPTLDLIIPFRTDDIFYFDFNQSLHYAPVKDDYNSTREQSRKALDNTLHLQTLFQDTENEDNVPHEDFNGEDIRRRRFLNVHIDDFDTWKDKWRQYLSGKNPALPSPSSIGNNHTAKQLTPDEKNDDMLTSLLTANLAIPSFSSGLRAQYLSRRFYMFDVSKLNRQLAFIISWASHVSVLADSLEQGQDIENFIKKPARPYISNGLDIISIMTDTLTNNSLRKKMLAIKLAQLHDTAPDIAKQILQLLDESKKTLKTFLKKRYIERLKKLATDENQRESAHIGKLSVWLAFSAISVISLLPNLALDEIQDLRHLIHEQLTSLSSLDLRPHESSIIDTIKHFLDTPGSGVDYKIKKFLESESLRYNVFTANEEFTTSPLVNNEQMSALIASLREVWQRDPLLLRYLSAILPQPCRERLMHNMNVMDMARFYSAMSLCIADAIIWIYFGCCVESPNNHTSVASQFKSLPSPYGIDSVQDLRERLKYWPYYKKTFNSLLEHFLNLTDSGIKVSDYIAQASTIENAFNIGDAVRILHEWAAPFPVSRTLKALYSQNVLPFFPLTDKTMTFWKNILHHRARFLQQHAQQHSDFTQITLSRDIDLARRDAYLSQAIKELAQGTQTPEDLLGALIVSANVIKHEIDLYIQNADEHASLKEIALAANQLLQLCQNAKSKINNQNQSSAEKHNARLFSNSMSNTLSHKPQNYRERIRKHLTEIFPESSRYDTSLGIVSDILHAELIEVIEQLPGISSKGRESLIAYIKTQCR